MSTDEVKVCYDCQEEAAIDTCPLCGRGVCGVCAEREGSFCCDANKCRLCERTADANGLCSVCSGQIDVVM
jgi:hypothetical protein